MISLLEALSFLKFSPTEERDLAKLESTLDASLVAQFNGAPLRLEFNQPIAPKLAYALQRKYEEGGNWRVQAQPLERSCSFIFTPMYVVGGKKAVLAPKSLPPLVRAERAETKKGGAVQNGRRLLVRMPTRGRPAQALEVLQKYREMAGCPITIEVVIDHDDKMMQSCEVLQRLNALGCIVTADAHASKVEAVNGGKVQDWDVLLLASDDMVPVADDYAVRVLDAMEKHWPYLDGALYFDDGHQGDKLCTLPVMGRRLYDQFLYVYNPEYQSLYCDLEQTAVLLGLRRLKYVDEKLIEHRHPIWGLAAPDATYARNDALDKRDREVFERRRVTRNQNAQLPFDTAPIWLSIGIATIPSRRAQLELLVAHIYDQTRDCGGHFQVELLFDDRVEPSIGEKRSAILDRAKGHYIAFIDDDDWVPLDYVSRILAVLKSEQPDCISLRGVMTTSGASPEVFEHSIRHSEWKTVDGVHLRSPNHLNPVKRELALQVGFKPMNHGEDHDYSTRLRHLLVREATAGDDPLYFYWFQPKGQAK